MITSLLDVNVLVALAWPSHVHHRLTTEWFDQVGVGSWATCPITQAGFIRISSNTRMVPYAVSPAAAIEVLKQLTSLGNHQFWPDSVDFTCDPEIPIGLLVGHRQITDAYLLGLAIRNGGTLVTLDRGVRDVLDPENPYAGAVTLLQGS